MEIEDLMFWRKSRLERLADEVTVEFKLFHVRYLVDPTEGSRPDGASIEFDKADARSFFALAADKEDALREWGTEAAKHPRACILDVEEVPYSISVR